MHVCMHVRMCVHVRMCAHMRLRAYMFVRVCVLHIHMCMFVKDNIIVNHQLFYGQFQETFKQIHFARTNLPRENIIICF